MSFWLRRSFAFVIAAALTLLGTWFSSYDGLEAANAAKLPDTKHFSKNMPRYPGAVTYPMGNELSMNGQAIEIGYFSTKDKLEKVANYFSAVWRSHGYSPDKVINSKIQGIVSVVDKREQQQMAVSLVVRNNETWGFVSLRALDGNFLKNTVNRKPLKTMPNPIETLIDDGYNPLTTTDRRDGKKYGQYSFFLHKPLEDTLEFINNKFNL